LHGGSQFVSSKKVSRSDFSLFLSSSSVVTNSDPVGANAFTAHMGSLSSVVWFSMFILSLLYFNDMLFSLHQSIPSMPSCLMALVLYTVSGFVPHSVVTLCLPLSLMMLFMFSLVTLVAFAFVPLSIGVSVSRIVIVLP
jgi:hypothetical protein